MSYKVKLNIFEGPLDLLLFLIKKSKIDIYDIPMSDITTKYLEYLDLMKMMDLEIAGEFLVMAATLLHIKSKTLLPKEEEENEEDETDPREELVRRLLEYKKFKDASDSLRGMYNKQKDVFVRSGEGNKGKIISDDGVEYFEASLFDLITSFRTVLKRVPKETFHQVVKSRYTVNDKIHQIFHILSENTKVFFLSLFEAARDKDEMIVTFLAILELMKMNEIFAVQKDAFGDIEIIRNSDNIKRESNFEEDSEEQTD